VSVIGHIVSNTNCHVCWLSLLCDHTEVSDVKCALEKHVLKSQFREHNI